MTTILNALRQAKPTISTTVVPAMSALAAPATNDAAVSLLFRE